MHIAKSSEPNLRVSYVPKYFQAFVLYFLIMGSDQFGGQNFLRMSLPPTHTYTVDVVVLRGHRQDSSADSGHSAV